MSVAGGVHTVTVEKEGFIRFSQDVEVSPQQALTLAEGNLIVSVESDEASGEPASRERQRPEGEGAPVADAPGSPTFSALFLFEAANLVADLRRFFVMFVCNR